MFDEEEIEQTCSTKNRSGGVTTFYELREDGTIELREDGSFELREN